MLIQTGIVLVGVVPFLVTAVFLLHRLQAERANVRVDVKAELDRKRKEDEKAADELVEAVFTDRPLKAVLDQFCADRMAILSGPKNSLWDEQDLKSWGKAQIQERENTLKRKTSFQLIIMTVVVMTLVGGALLVHYGLIASRARPSTGRTVVLPTLNSNVNSGS